MIALEKEKFGTLTELLKTVNINHLFARSVIEGCVSGKVYVDDADQPKTAYVVHPYGMSLLFGDCTNKDFNNSFRDYALNKEKKREKYEWMQAYPCDWDPVLGGLFGDRIVQSSEAKDCYEEGIVELNTRVNFKFNPAKYEQFKSLNSDHDFKVVRTDKQMSMDMKGTVIPLNFWDTAEDFSQKGVGFSLFSENQLASTAYSAFIHDDKLEIGIETVEAFRGKGFAQYVCEGLIDYCIENKYEPVWSCRLENVGSCRLAHKLGFERVLLWPFYRLPK
jgi:RimJ/RimL family protein N-acetyltransferase